MPDELDHVVVGHDRRMVHRRVRGEQLRSPAAVSYQELAVDELMAEHLIAGQ